VMVPKKQAQLGEAPIYWRFPCGAGCPAIFGDVSR
jgi:hypothetical protein